MPNQRFSFYTKKQSKALLDRLAHEKEVNFDYVVVDRDCDLDHWVERIQVESCFITLDTETKGFTPAPGMVKTIQIAYSSDVPVLIIKLPKIEDRNSLKRLMANTKMLKVGHQT